MSKYESKVRQFIASHNLIQAGDKVVVGVSGGPDSLSLLHFLHQFRNHYQIELYAAHLDHMFRGEESLDELRFVEAFCRRHDIICLAESVDVKAIMKRDKTGGQDTARKARYDFYKRSMKELKADKLALAHHGDDQIETILMQLTRGSSGHKGIPYRRSFEIGEIIRPLLPLTKEEIEEYCLTHQLKPRRDPSNSSEHYTRNRFRIHVLPFLKKENPKVHEHFQRFSEEIDEDESFLQELTRQKMNRVWEKENGKVNLQINAFLTMPLPLQRRGIHLILNYLYKGKTAYSAIHIQQTLHLLKSDHPSGRLDLPDGLKVIRSYDVCNFSFHINEKASFYVELQPNERIVLPTGAAFLLTDNPSDLNEKGGCEQFKINPAEVTLPIIIRTRKSGDRISLKGTKGSKKIKDLFIDSKVPLELRDQWPIVTDSSGKILWVPGLKRSNFEARQFNDKHLILCYTNVTIF
ncbi:MAG TPA: tRNA lysidine(34) synthetase TilS [Chondromyces sp.]|nr:tRNA lysidine(34) synthetase TilS [Chondromyces sp.]